MFEPKKEYTEYEYKSLRLPKELVEKAQKVAKEYELSFNKIVIQCMEYALDRVKEIKDENNS
ncbi:Arc family DNA-binding protein [Lachnospiraceae bacterium WCA-9-b2]|uniref:Arc family DNA-binding protein n=1 Tax=Sporofaciens musculi TaxID=2681861 RepID=A0A7X3SHR4_9FIRM|nr:Arc family DNA-binding protein [Sporofaciens musculi]MXP74664.1 Arc family DNA-binding protein [Sporofaciens musculi]